MPELVVGWTGGAGGVSVTAAGSERDSRLDSVVKTLLGGSLLGSVLTRLLDAKAGRRRNTPIKIKAMKPDATPAMTRIMATISRPLFI